MDEPKRGDRYRDNYGGGRLAHVLAVVGGWGGPYILFTDKDDLDGVTEGSFVTQCHWEYCFRPEIPESEGGGPYDD